MEDQNQNQSPNQSPNQGQIQPQPQAQPESIEEALGSRADQLQEEELPEPTQDEVVADALRDVNLETRLGTQYPETAAPMPTTISTATTEKVEFKLMQPEKKENQRAAPVSITSHQQEQETSTLESPEPPQNQQSPGSDAALQRLLDFVNGDEFSINWCRYHLISVCGNPAVLPTSTLWDIPPQIDIAKLIFDVVRAAGFVENTWPTLRVVMGPSKDNARWACGVLCTMALFRAIDLLPLSQALTEMEGEIQ